MLDPMSVWFFIIYQKLVCRHTSVGIKSTPDSTGMGLTVLGIGSRDLKIGWDGLDRDLMMADIQKVLEDGQVGFKYPCISLSFFSSSPVPHPLACSPSFWFFFTSVVAPCFFAFFYPLISNQHLLDLFQLSPFFVPFAQLFKFFLFQIALCFDYPSRFSSTWLLFKMSPLCLIIRVVFPDSLTCLFSARLFKLSSFPLHPPLNFEWSPFHQSFFPLQIV